MTKQLALDWNAAGFVDVKPTTKAFYPCLREIGHSPSVSIWIDTSYEILLPWAGLHTVLFPADSSCFLSLETTPLSQSFTSASFPRTECHIFLNLLFSSLMIGRDGAVSTGSTPITGLVASFELLASGDAAPFSVPLSECSPIGFNGRRRVPLFGMGVIDKESQMRLYTSIFSASSSIPATPQNIQITHGISPACCWVHEEKQALEPRI